MLQLTQKPQFLLVDISITGDTVQAIPQEGKEEAVANSNTAEIVARLWMYFILPCIIRTKCSYLKGP